MIAIDLSKQQALDANPRARNTRINFILEEAKKIVLDVFQETVKVL